MSTSLTLSDEFLSTTSFNHLEQGRNALSLPHPVFEAVMGAKKKNAGGEVITIPFNIRRHSTRTQLTSGYEVPEIDVQTTMKPGTDNQHFSLQPIAWSTVDEAKNQGELQRISIIKQRTDDVHDHYEEDVEIQLLKGTVASLSDLNTLNGDDVATGFLEGVAAGSQTNTVHGLSKTTYQALNGFQNRFMDFSNDFSANGEAQLRTGMTALKSRVMGARLAGFCSESASVNYGTLAQTQERYAKASDIITGAPDIVVNGVPTKISLFMPNDGTTTSAAGSEWSFLYLDLDAICLHLLPGWEMTQTEFRQLSGREVSAAWVKFGGQLTINFWGSHLVGIGGETY